MLRIRNVLFAGWLLTVLVLAGCALAQEKGPAVQPFEFINQNDEPFGLEQVKGKVWIADFIFTNCKTVCPPMTFAMAGIQEALEKQGLEAEIVSFSVDPTVDSPEVLKEYVSRYTQNQANWNLLTGYSQKEIKEFALEGFQTLILKPDETSQVLHGVNFYVVNPEGIVVNELSFTDPDLIDVIVDEVARYQP